MATALSAQLAQIRAKSTFPLDVKAQKKAHGRSLIFESKVAANQDFETIYQICLEGFEDLCRIDTRFLMYGGNIFSEQSKDEDRTQMNPAQERKLNEVLEDFLRLVGGKLLLTPAIKAVEWLIRRFRIHEYNTLCFVLTFLPYSSTPLFTSVLSIMPSANRMPLSLKFLHPYIRSLANPPRHAIVHAATTGNTFLAIFNTFVLDCCRYRYHYSLLVSQWASICTEAIAGMLDNASLARGQNQSNIKEDIVLRVLPILDQGLRRSSPQELKTACYVILAVLLHKADLGETMLDSLTEAVVRGWDTDLQDGFTTLALLVSKKRSLRLPRIVRQVLLDMPDLAMVLKSLQQKVPIEKLSISLAIGTISGCKGKLAPKEQAFLRDLLLGKALTNTSILMVVKIIIQTHKAQPSSVAMSKFLNPLLRDLLNLDPICHEIQALCKEYQLDIEGANSEASLDPAVVEEYSPRRSFENPSAQDRDKRVQLEELGAILTRPSFQEFTVQNFLSEPIPAVFMDLADVLSSIRMSSKACDRFFRLPILCRASAFQRPTFFSFCMRIWCGFFPDDARVKALEAAQEEMESHKNQVDPGIIFPYLIHGLSDRSQSVRYASRELALAIAALEVIPMPGSARNLSLIGDFNVYKTNDKYPDDMAAGLQSFDMPHPVHLANSLLIPYLEEAQLDGNAIARNITSVLKSSSKIRGQENASKRLTSEARAVLVSDFCRHIVSTPLFPTKVTLLRIVHGVGKVAQASKMEMFATLLPAKHSDVNEAKIVSCCAEQAYDPSIYFEYLMKVVGPGDKEAVDILFRHLSTTSSKISPLTYATAGRRLEQIWHSSSDEVQDAIAFHLLRSALEQSEDSVQGEPQGKALLNLWSFDLRSSTLRMLFAEVPRLFANLQQSSHASKRRKTNHCQSTAIPNPPKREIDYLTIVLESLDASESARDPGLLTDIFPIIEDLQKCTHFYVSSLAYLQILALRAALRIVASIEQIPHHDFDRFGVRIDVLVDCVKSTNNIQVQQAALLLISNLATVAPELVLHGVMPVFTFMGSSFIRNDDEYSMRVVNRTIDSVVPRLVQSLQKGAGNPISRVSQLLLSFVATYEHVPPQRRLELFSSIGSKIGVEQYLYALLAILVDKYPNDEEVYRFASDLAASQTMYAQISILQRLLDVVKDTLQPKPGIAKYLFSGNTYSVSGSKLLRLVILMLNNPDFTNVAEKARNERDADVENLRAAYSNMIEQMLTTRELTSMEAGMRPLVEEAFSSIYSLLPLPDFCKILPELLKKLDDGLNEQVLVSFERRLKSASAQFKGARTASLEILPSLSTMQSKSKNVDLRRATISCITQIVEKFGKKDEAAVLAIASIVSEAIHDSNNKICSSATLCLATCVTVIGENFIPLLQPTVPRVLELLRLSCIEGTEDMKLHNAAFSFLTSLLLYVHFMVSQDYLEQILKASHDSSSGELGPAADKIRSGCMELIAMQLDLPQCLQSLERTWSSAVSAGPVAVKEHLSVLGQAIERHKKSVLGKQVDHLGSLFLKMLDLRSIQFSPRTDDSYEETDVDDIEDTVNDCLIATIYKLNDNLFRPLFNSFISWPESLENQHASTLRKISLYKFLHQFFDSLKSIVTSYSSIIIPPTIASLMSLSKSPNLDADAQTLWHRIFETLSACFTYDQDELFLSLPAPPAPPHSAPPLTDSIPSNHDSPPLLAPALLSFLPHLITSLPPTATTLYLRTLTAYALATDGSPPHHRHLNLSLLAFLRASNTHALQHMLFEKDAAKVKVVVVKAQRALTEKLGEQWLGPNLAEMLPVMREALDDDDEEGVVMEVERWKWEAGEVTGEDIGEMMA